MKKLWKRNMVAGAVLLLVCGAIFLNGRYAQQVEETDKILGQATLVDGTEGDAEEVSGEALPGDYFATARLTRQQARDSALSLLQEASGAAEVDEAAAAEAAQSIQTLAAYTLAEAQIENMITAKGYTDCVVFMADALRASLDRSLRGAVLLALTVLLTGAADGFASSLGENASRFVPLVGVLCVTTLSAGDLSSLIGLGTATMQDLADLTKLLLPTMAAALAGCGGVFTASAWQVGTLFAADALTTLIHELLLPLVYCHIALASAGAALPESGLDKLADGLKKLISWLLCGAVTAFTLYLSVSGVLTGSADRAAVKAAQAAVSGAVPVVGSILAESAEMVLSAAHSLRAAIGAAGVLGVLLACLAPLVRLSVQFLLYRAAAFVSAVSGVKPLERLLEQLGDAFALVLGMTAACAALLLAALLVSISMVVM